MIVESFVLRGSPVSQRLRELISLKHFNASRSINNPSSKSGRAAIGVGVFFEVTVRDTQRANSSNPVARLAFPCARYMQSYHADGVIGVVQSRTHK